MSLSPAKTASLSLIGMPSTAVSANGSFVARPAGRRLNVAAVARGTCGSRPPTAARGSALGVGRAHGDDVVEHLLEDVGGPVDDVAALGEHRRVVVVDLAEVGEVLALGVGRVADRLGPRRSRRRSPIRLIDSFEAKNSAQIQNAGEHDDDAEDHVAPRARPRRRLVGAPAAVAIAVTSTLPPRRCGR